MGRPVVALQPKHLAQLRRAGIGHNGATNIDGRDGAVAVVPLLNTQGRGFVIVNIDLGIRHMVFVQEPLGDAAVASPGGRVYRHRWCHEALLEKVVPGVRRCATC